MEREIHPAKKYLMEIKKIDVMIENKKKDKEFWEAVATGTTAPLSERVQTSSNGQKMVNAVLKTLDVQKQIDSYIQQLCEKRNEIINVIEQLNADEYDLLHKVYVQYYTLKEVQYIKRKAYSSIISIHGRALDNVLKILERNKENE